MLERLKAYLAYHGKAGQSSLGFIKSNLLATCMTIIVIAITLALPAVFWVFADNLQQLSGNWQRSGHISLYLDSAQPVDTSVTLERVRATPGVESALLKLPAEGLAELQQQEGMQDIMQYLPENPLPAVIDVIPDASINTTEKNQELYQTLRSYPHIEQARFDIQWVSRLYTLLEVASKIAHGTMLLLASAVVLIIGHTLRMVIHNRQEEIQVLSFIGASRSYIIRPFLYLGVFYGIAAAVMAMILVQIIMLSIGALINQLAETYDMHYVFVGLSFGQALLLLLSAMSLGWVGARLSVSSLCRSHVG